MCSPICRRIRDSHRRPAPPGQPSAPPARAGTGSRCAAAAPRRASPPRTRARPACARVRRARCPAPERGRSRARRRSAGRPGSSAGRPFGAAGVAVVGGMGMWFRWSRARPSPPSGGWARASSRAAVPPTRPAIRASTVPTSTVSPTGTRISATTPVAGAGTSVSILSVEISQIVSSASIRSPTSTRQATTVPSATDTPIWGIVTSTRTSVGEELTARLPHSIDAGQHRLLERRRERDRNVGRRHPDDRPVESTRTPARRSAPRPGRRRRRWRWPRRRSRPSSSARPSRGSPPRRAAPATAGRAPRPRRRRDPRSASSATGTIAP